MSPSRSAHIIKPQIVKKCTKPVSTQSHANKTYMRKYQTQNFRRMKSFLNTERPISQRKVLKNLLEKKKVGRMGQQTEKKIRHKKLKGIGRKTREEIVKWNQMTTPRFPGTGGEGWGGGGRHQTCRASLRGSMNELCIKKVGRNGEHQEVSISLKAFFVLLKCFRV